MYTPNHFREDDPRACWRLIQEFPLATLLGPGDAISHLPLIGVEGRLWGHLARANPHSAGLNGTPVRAVFLGPHGYVSPRWYSADHHVPTWNYTSVHVHGVARVHTAPEVVAACLTNLSAVFEGEDGWKTPFDEDWLVGLARAVVAVEIEPVHLEGKFKLSQNRTVAERVGVIEAFATSTRPSDQELARWMASYPYTRKRTVSPQRAERSARQRERRNA